jgi:hypothetical protein
MLRPYNWRHNNANPIAKKWGITAVILSERYGFGNVHPGWQNR